jgi:hypothetical protein
MPTSGQILASLTAIANEWASLATAWHVYFAALVVLLAQVRLSQRSTGILLSAPLLSVSALAWAAENPFNGITFLMAAAALMALAVRLPRVPIGITGTGLLIAGAVLFVFGWVYPHFLNTASYLPYLYAAPMGLIPCPTLSAIAGLTLIAGGISRAWSLVLAGISAFYGIFGAVVLGVTIDLVLTAGAAILFWHAIRVLRRGSPPYARIGSRNASVEGT